MGGWDTLIQSEFRNRIKPTESVETTQTKLYCNSGVKKQL